MAAQLTDEPSSGPEGVESSRNRCVGIVLDPVQDGIGKDGIEFVLEDQCSGIHDPHVKASLACSRNHVRRIVDAHHLRTRRHQLFGQRSVAATQIEDALPGLRLKQVHHRLPECRHEISVRLIGSCAPFLG
jgi:hypothetical protein